MSSEEIKNILDDFNKKVNDEVAFEFIDDISDASNILWDYLVNDRKLSFEKRNFIIGFICNDYMHDPFINEEIIDLDKAIEKFNSDNIFGVNVLDNYIDKYFQDAILINRYNNLNLNYFENLEIEDDEVSDRIFEDLNNSSFFNSEEKEKIIKYMIKECQLDILNNKDSYEFVDDYLKEDYLNNLEYYYENIDDVNINDDEFIFNLIDHYFVAFISDDFKVNRLEFMINSIIENNRVPSFEKTNDVYEKILIKNEKYDYLEAIEYILGFVDGDIDCYDKFINDKEYGINQIIKFCNLSVGSIENENNKEVFFINELARDILYNLIGNIDKDGSSTSHIEHYFNKGFAIAEYYESYKIIYGVSFENMAKIQKICLISDYYNKYSDSINKDNIEFNSIKIISENSIDKLLDIFDDNLEFKKSLIESFVDDCLSNNDIKLCSDVKTLKKVNPFIIMEMSTNKAYQKKIS